MTSKRTAQTNQQQNSEKPQASGILQRAAVRSSADAGVQSTDDKEIQPLSNLAFAKDFSRVPISTTKPQQIMAKLTIGPVGDKYEQEADRVAAQVVQRINAPASVQSGEDETIQREKMETKDNEARLMRSPILQRSKGKISKHDRKQGRLEKESGEERFIPPEADKPYSVSFNSKTTNPYTAEEIQELLDRYKPGDLFEVNPNRLRTMHAGISDKFGEDTPIDDTIAKLKSDKSSLKHLPSIKIAALEIPRKPWERQTSDEPRNIKQLALFTEDHRRVVAAREAGVESLQAQLKATPTVTSNYTTTNMGMSVEVRSYRTAEEGRHQGGNKSTFPGSGKVFQHKDEELQMKPMLSLHAGEVRMNATSDLETSINQARGGGQPLAHNIREPMEQAFGADFSRVKIYTDAQSDQLNRSIEARAFTTGQDVFFRQGEYNPKSRGGQELLAHELTHVVQQKNFLTSPTTVSLGRVLQRKIQWNTQAKAPYQQSEEGLLQELTSEFFWVEKEKISELIRQVDQKSAKWTPYEAYIGIKNNLRKEFPMPPSKVDIGSTNITKDEAKWYFVSNFKTMMEAIIDNKWSYKFFNTPDDKHAEDNMMLKLDKLIVQEGWDKDFSESHTLLIRINNSPCRRCAKRIYEWGNRDIFDELHIQFANMYEKDKGFTEATTKLKSGGVIMSLVSVTSDLIPLIEKENELKLEGIKEREKKDQQEASNWKNWQERSLIL